MNNKSRYSQQLLTPSKPDSSLRYSALNSNDVEQFFAKQSHTTNTLIAITHTEAIESKLSSALHNGNITITNPETLPESSTLNLLSLNHKKYKLQRELEALNHLIQSEKFKPIRSIKSSRLTEEEHQRVMKRIRKQKKEGDVKRENYVRELKQERQEERLKSKQAGDKQKEERNEQKRNRISLEMKKREQHKKAIEKSQQKSSSLDKSKTNKKLLYRQLQDRYIQQVVLPAIQQRNSKIKEIKNLKRPIRIDQIKKHQQNYIRRREEKSFQLLSSKQQIPKYEPSFKSSRLEKMRIEDEKVKRENESLKKNLLSEKMERIESFKRYVASNFKPTVSEEKRKELEDKILGQSTKVKERANSTNIYEKGTEYLNYSKARMKKDSNPSEQTIEIYNIHQKTRPNSNKPNYISSNSNSPIPTKLQRVESIINSLRIPNESKVEELQVETEIIDEMIMKKEKMARVKELKEKSDSSGLLLASIKARIGLLEMGGG